MDETRESRVRAEKDSKKREREATRKDEGGKEKIKIKIKKSVESALSVDG